MGTDQGIAATGIAERRIAEGAIANGGVADRNIIVVKLGGRTQGDPALPSALAALWRASGGRLVIVHGGGDQISALQRMRGEEPVFVGGRRVSTPLVLELVRMVLSGGANKQLVSVLTAAGVDAVGVSGEDAALLAATPIDRATFGSSGTPGRVNAKLVHHLLAGGFLPVISPVATDLDDSAHGALNVNGDDAAAAIAVALGAMELLLMVDVDGVLDADRALIPSLTLSDAYALVKSGVAGGGMAAKLEACAIALTGGVRRVRVGNVSSLGASSAGTEIVGSSHAGAAATSKASSP
ncbi:MAG: acetylglutamate kinase [Gemmatimonadaceae bacterium]